MAAADPIPGERIARGIDVLEPACPFWYVAPDPDQLDFTDPERGILAAIYGHHADGLRLLAIAPEDAANYGFAARNPEDARRLRLAWIAWIATSRDAADTPHERDPAHVHTYRSPR